MEIFNVLSNHDQILTKRLNDGPQNALYISPLIQNSLLNIMGSMVRRKICDDIRKSVYYSILADETKDVSKKEQLTIVLRFVDDNAVIHENFLTFVEASELNAAGLTSYILSVLKEHRLDPENIVSQGYDGASVMSGKYKGVQQRIKEIAPHAEYIHCYAHTLNLVLVDSTKSNQYANDFFILLESLYVFVSTFKYTVYF